MRRYATCVERARPEPSNLGRSSSANAAVAAGSARPCASIEGLIQIQKLYGQMRYACLHDLFERLPKKPLSGIGMAERVPYRALLR